MYVEYGMDHRVLDGATAARFNKKVKEYLEMPGTMLLRMKWLLTLAMLFYKMILILYIKFLYLSF